MTDVITTVFVEQLLALPGFAMDFQGKPSR